MCTHRIKTNYFNIPRSVSEPSTDKRPPHSNLLKFAIVYRLLRLGFAQNFVQTFRTDLPFGISQNQYFDWTHYQCLEAQRTNPSETISLSSAIFRIYIVGPPSMRVKKKKTLNVRIKSKSQKKFLHLCRVVSWWPEPPCLWHISVILGT